MNALLNSGHPRPSHALADLLDQHGLWPVLRALFAAQHERRKRKRARALTDLLPDYLQRDIGLPPMADPTRPHLPRK